MTTQRVRLTPAAAARFPDLAGRTGTCVFRESDTFHSPWYRVEWPAITVWLRGEDLEFVPKDELLSLDPSDPNAPAP